MLSAEQVSFGYEARVPLLDAWSETFSAGEMVAITGPSGRGKSTLLYILGLMLRPRTGRVLLHGESVADRSDRQRAALRAHYFGFVFQDAALDPTRTVLDNVMEGMLYRSRSVAHTTAKRRAVELLDQFGVRLRSAARPGQVSGGQAQRIALCRALLNDPRVILADEPTGNLDLDSTHIVLTALRERARSGTAVIVVTHDPDIGQRCDRVVRL